MNGLGYGIGWLALSLALGSACATDESDGAKPQAVDASAAGEVNSDATSSPDDLGTADIAGKDSVSLEVVSPDTMEVDVPDVGNPDTAVTCEPSECNDDNPCTADECRPTGGCSFEPIAGACDDGNGCTEADACVEGTCIGTVLDCSSDEPCVVPGCHPETGCVADGMDDGVPCDTDGSICTVESCQSSTCSGVPIACDDSNPCTDDSCDGAIGCVFTPNEIGCDDGNACTEQDACSSGTCAGSTVACDDGSSCTFDSCDPEVGCIVTPIVDGAPCDSDESVCSVETCLSGACASEAKVCDDANPCTTDTCDAELGCLFTDNTLACDDASACTTNDICSVGACAGTAVDCNDDNICTTNSCDPTTGCVVTVDDLVGDCDTDESVCTVEFCEAGQCETTALECDDGDLCTLDSCHPLEGCQFATQPGVCTGCTEPEPGADGLVADTVAFGEGNYIKYIRGDLPIILTSPHGGALTPDALADRTYGVTGSDSNSRQTTYEIINHIKKLTGRQPHVVINRLHRSKLDANREIIEAAQGDAGAEAAWVEFHQFIEMAKEDASARCGEGLHLDIHTNGHDAEWTEMGMLLSANELGLSNTVMNSADALVDKSSVRRLATGSTEPLSEIVRGEESLGGMLEAEGYSSVPSPVNPSPDGQGYFNGGYNTRVHGSRDGGMIDSIQIENWFGFMSDGERDAYAAAVARSIVSFYERHYGVSLVDEAFESPANSVCAGAEHLTLTDGSVSIVGTTTGADDEFGTAVTCGTGFWLDGPQVYYTVDLMAEHTYDFTFTPSFGARAFLFGDTCDAAEIQSQCSSSAISAELVATNATKSYSVTPGADGRFTFAVDSRAYAWFGRFELSISEVVVPE
ncbi:MAG: hypothetical protein ACI9OJ_005180 [Myxococcota bacterium]|jgi:hypothetical protein